MSINWLTDRIGCPKMRLWTFEAIGGLLVQRLRNFLHGPNFHKKNKRYLTMRWGGALPKLLEAYIDEATFPTNPTKAQPLWALAQCGSMVANYALDCCSVVLANAMIHSRLDFFEWKSRSNMCVGGLVINL